MAPRPWSPKDGENRREAGEYTAVLVIIFSVVSLLFSAVWYSATPLTDFQYGFSFNLELLLLCKSWAAHPFINSSWIVSCCVKRIVIRGRLGAWSYVYLALVGDYSWNTFFPGLREKAFTIFHSVCGQLSTVPIIYSISVSPLFPTKRLALDAKCVDCISMCLSYTVYFLLIVFAHCRGQVVYLKHAV